MRQSGLFGLSDHMKRLSADGDPLEVLARVVDFEAFRPTLIGVLVYSDGAKGTAIHIAVKTVGIAFPPTAER